MMTKVATSRKARLIYNQQW